MNAPRPELTTNVQLGRLASEYSGTHHLSYGHTERVTRVRGVENWHFCIGNHWFRRKDALKSSAFFLRAYAPNAPTSGIQKM